MSLFSKYSASVLILTTFLALTGCASAPVDTSAITAEVLSEPPGVELTYRGKKIGTAPLEFKIDDLGDAVEIATNQELPPVVERRIKILADERIQVIFRLSDQPSDLAKALGLSKVLVFDYGGRTTFDSEESELKPSFEPALIRQAEVLDKYFSDIDIYVCGHTDSTGQDDFNLLLSLNRAKAVADFLESQGISESRLKVQGFGSDYPLAPNAEAEGRALNRRTEIVLPDGE